MTVRYSFLAIDEDYQLVDDWFASLKDETTVNDSIDRTVYYFRMMDTKPLPPIEMIDQNKTPLVFIVKPQKRRGTLWTDAEVMFTPTPLKQQFPELDNINKSFAKWLKKFDLVFSRKNELEENWNYFLEAGIQNFDGELYALPKVMAALRSGQYFVSQHAGSQRLETLAKSLRLRGYFVEDDQALSES
ncbi:hypothetical protein [Collimonas humicola]|uniref:hypothetical protein n=1 Tax=Collimonas humicola TaxID=2825886 RepID=UPI001B8CB422|nr:hypothetical protein [Collimonas humicola]